MLGEINAYPVQLVLPEVRPVLWEGEQMKCFAILCQSQYGRNNE